MTRKILIVHNKVSAGAAEDERDVLEQASLVADSCRELGYVVDTLEMDLNLEEATRRIRAQSPDLLFNLVESLDNKGEFVLAAPLVFISLQIPFSGSPLIPMLLASNKVMAKEKLQSLGLPTPAWFTTTDINLLGPAQRYILKPMWEEGSLDLDESSVFCGDDDPMKRMVQTKSPDHYFIETYVEGREFNISILAGRDGPEVLPVAEMQFHDYPVEKPQILGYASKWLESSFEYTHTTRSFEAREEDYPLYKKLVEYCRVCWLGFGLKGYARVDFRVDPEGIPYIIDINANPCLSASGGFAAAVSQAGYTYTEAIRRILDDAAG